MHATRMYKTGLVVVGIIGWGLMSGWCGRSARSQGEPSAKVDWRGVIAPSDVSGLLAAEAAAIEKITGSSARFKRGTAGLVRSGQRVAILGNIGTLVMDGAEKKKAAAVREAGLALAQAAAKKDFEGAQAAARTIEAYPDRIEPAQTDAPVPFPQLIELQPLMLIVNTLEDDLEPLGNGPAESFAQLAKPAVGPARWLAALGLASGVYEDDSDWVRWCQQWAQASSKLAGEAQAGNADAAKSAWAELQRSCRDCHKANGVETK